MISGDQIRRLAQTVSYVRFQAFPCRVDYNGKTYTGSCTGIKSKQSLGEAGFMFSHDGIVRLPFSADYPNGPALDKQLTIYSLLPGAPQTGQRARIAEVIAHPNNPEWRIGVKAV
jgi:hypothetical protein